MKTPLEGRAGLLNSLQKRMLPRVGYRQLDNSEDGEAGVASAGVADVDEEGVASKRALPLPRLGMYERDFVRLSRAAPLPRLGALKRAVDLIGHQRATRRVSMLRMGKRAVSMLRMGKRQEMERHQRRVSMLRMGKKSDSNYQ